MATGLAELVSILQAMPTRAKAQVETAVKDTADSAVSRLRDASPVKTGDFKAAWHVESDAATGDQSIVNDVPYAVYAAAESGCVDNTMPTIEADLDHNVHQALRGRLT
jgi:hypothetical protein